MMADTHSKNRWKAVYATFLFVFPSFLLVSGAASALDGLTLEQAMRLSVQKAPQVRQAQSLVDAQVERRRASLSDLGPKVRAEWNDVYFDEKLQRSFGENVIIMRDDHTRSGSLTVLQPITGLYGLIEKSRFESTNVDARNLALDLSRQQIALHAAESYLRAQGAHELEMVAQGSLEAAKAQEKDGRQFLEVGRLSQGDYLKLQVAFSEANSRLADAVALKEISTASLRQLIDLPAAEPLALAPPEGIDEARGLPVPTSDTAIAQALQANTDYNLAKTNRDIIAFNKKLAYTEFLPSLNAFAKFDKNFNPIEGEAETTRSYGLSLTWEIFSSGASIFHTREAADQIRAAEEGVRAVEQTIRIEVLRHLANLQAQKISLGFADDAVKQAGEAYRIEKVKFNSGISSTAELLLAEASLTAARSRIISSRTDYRLSWLQLRKAMGEDLLGQPGAESEQTSQK